MMNVSLHPITAQNWQECVTLSVAAEQAQFLPSNLYSLAEAQFYPAAQPLAIYNEMGAMIGFALYGKEYQTDLWKIFRLMIDQRFQRRGYGRMALAALVDHLWQLPEPTDILIAYQTSNTVAKALYERSGFVAERIDGPRATARLIRNVSPNDC